MVSYGHLDAAERRGSGESVDTHSSCPASGSCEPGLEPKKRSIDRTAGAGIHVPLAGTSSPPSAAFTALSSPSGVNCSATATLHHPQPDQASLLELLEPRCLFRLFSFFDVSELPIFFLSRYLKLLVSHAFGVRQCVSLTLQTRWQWRSKDLALFFTLCENGGVRLSPESMQVAKRSFGSRVGVEFWPYLSGQGAFLRYISIDASAHAMYSLDEQYSLLGTHSSTLEELRIRSCRRSSGDLAGALPPSSPSDWTPGCPDSTDRRRARNEEFLQGLVTGGQATDSGRPNASAPAGRASGGAETLAASAFYRPQHFPRLRLLTIVGEVLIPYSELLSSCLNVGDGRGSRVAFPALETLVLYNSQLGQGDTLELESRVLPWLSRALPTLRSFVFIGWKCDTGVRALLRLLFVPGPDNGALERVRLGCYSTPTITTTRWFELVSDHAASLADHMEWDSEQQLTVDVEGQRAASSTAGMRVPQVWMASGRHVATRSVERVHLPPAGSAGGARGGAVVTGCARSRLESGLERGGVSLHCGTNANFKYVVAAVGQLRRLTGGGVPFAVEGNFFISLDDFDLQTVSEHLPTIDIRLLFPSLEPVALSAGELSGTALDRSEQERDSTDVGSTDIHLTSIRGDSEPPRSDIHSRRTAVCEEAERETACPVSVSVEGETRPGGVVSVFRRARVLRLHLRDSSGRDVRQSTGSRLSASLRHLFVYAPAYQDEVLTWSQSRYPLHFPGQPGGALPTVGLFDEQLAEGRHDWSLIIYSRVIPCLSEIVSFALEAPSGAAGFDFYRRLVPAICSLPHLRRKFVGVELTPRKSVLQSSNFAMLLRSLPDGMRPPLGLVRISVEGSDADLALLGNLRTALREVLGMYTDLRLVEVEQRDLEPRGSGIRMITSGCGRQGVDELLRSAGFKFDKVFQDEVTLDRVITYSRISPRSN